jgi:hypothetical protein
LTPRICAGTLRVVDLLDLVGAPGVELEPIEIERLDSYLESVETRL